MNLDLSTLIGKTVGQVANQLIENKLEIRIISRDNINLVPAKCCISEKKHSNRINLKLINNKIVDAFIG